MEQKSYCQMKICAELILKIDFMCKKIEIKNFLVPIRVFGDIIRLRVYIALDLVAGTLDRFRVVKRLNLHYTQHEKSS